MTTWSEERDAIEARLRTLAGVNMTTQVSWADLLNTGDYDTFVPPAIDASDDASFAGAVWLAPSILKPEAQAVGTGGGNILEQSRGLFTVRVFAPHGTTTTGQDTIVNALVDLFAYQTFSGIDCRQASVIPVATREGADKYYQVNVAVEYLVYRTFPAAA